MVNDVSIGMAFAAGVVSFLSPCVLPIVPGYISFISGVSISRIEEKYGGANLAYRERAFIMLNALFFIAGFSGVFILLGASATWMGGWLSAKLSILTKIAGLVIVVFGLFKIGLIRPLAFYKERRFNIEDKKFGLLGAALIGAAFAFGWTPCIGPILAGILAYAGTLEHVNQGITLLAVYALGLGIPFLLTALAINRFFRFFDKIKRYLGLFEKVTGVIMVVLGLLIFFNKLILIPGYLSFLNKLAL
jgi:cytochrome c-type biogenesis protein